MLRFALAALFGSLLLGSSAFGAPPARASATGGPAAGAETPSTFELAGMKPAVDVARFDSESVLRAVFMTAVFGFVVLGRSSRRKAAEPPEPRRALAPGASRGFAAPISLPAAIAGGPLLALPVPAAAASRAGDFERHGPVVWVNTSTGVVHERDSRWFGNTREGEFVLKRSVDTGSYLSVRHVRARTKLPALG